MKWFAWLILGFILGFSWQQDLSGCNGKPDKEAELYALLQASEDSLQTFRKRNGEQLAVIQAYATSNSKYLTQLAKKDAKIAEFDRIIRRFNDPVAVIQHKTEMKVQGRGEVVINANLEEIDFPIVATKQDDWFNGRVDIYKDRSVWDAVFKNEVHFAIEKKKRGFAGIKGIEYQVKAVSLNPYSNTEELRGLTIQDKPSRLHLGVFTGVDINLKPTLGIGLSYSIISI